MYSYTMNKIIASSSFEDGEVLSITMAHLGLLFHLLGLDYNLLLNFMLQEPYDSFGITYSQPPSVSSGHDILFGSRIKSKGHHSLSYQCISVVLHGPRIHHAIVHIPKLVEHIQLLHKKKIPPDILIYFWVYTYFVSLSYLFFKGCFVPWGFPPYLCYMDQ